jgi:ribosomal protein L12E/L44/L45/RPP1/RPP2
MCAEALGWIDPENVANATKGMEVEVDAEWVKARSAKLRKEMDDLVESGSRK